MATRQLALRFLTDRSQDGFIPLDRDPFIIGRQSGVALVLVDEFVSRRHARLTFEGDDLVVEDLGSTNGTYLNGVRVTRGRVAEGDRILVGGSILKVVARDDASAASWAAAAAAGATAANAGVDAAATAMPCDAAFTASWPAAAAAASAGVDAAATAMEGSLDVVPLPDLLQLLATTGKAGVINVQRDRHMAEVHLQDGRITQCVIDGRKDISAKKNFYRLLAWTSGHFELRRTSSSCDGPAPAAPSVEALLLEGSRQLDEMQRLRCKLPTRFAVGAVPSEVLDREDRSLLALAAQDRSLDELLDATPLLDLEAAQRLIALFTRGFLVADLGPAEAVGHV